MPTYSLVAPLYDEDAVLEELLARLGGVMDKLDGDSEVILVDDGSSDRTYELMQDAAKNDPRVRLVRLSRNFGHQAAVTAGIDVSSGDAVVIIDADLQDPPEVILDMAARWREGYDVVYGIRDIREGDAHWKRAAAAIFYRSFNRISEIEVPLDVGDFRLVDRRVLDVFDRMRESNRYVRGMFSWIGLKQTGVLYRRQGRYAGDSKYPLRKLLRLAWSGVTSFSVAPLRVALNVGFAVALISFGLGVWGLIVKLAGFYNPPGWTSIVVVTTFIGGIQLIVLGMTGEYIADIHGEVKQRPLYVIDEFANFPEPPELPPRAFVATRRRAPEPVRDR